MKADNSNIKKMARAFLKIGCIGFGGGSALIPVIHKEFVTENELVSEDDFNRDVLVAVATPGALPVEISAGIGSRICGIPGFFLAPVCISLPGVILSLCIMIVLGVISQELTMQFKLLSIGIISYIISEVLIYVVRAIKSLVCKFEDEQKATCGSIESLGTRIRTSVLRISIALLVILIVTTINSCISHELFVFSWRACLSSILSFGGGNAYMAIAESLFVSANLLKSDIFYSVIIPIVNATPGSILCKTLPCIGYCIGYSLGNNVLTGILIACCGYIISICMSCLTYAVGISFIDAITTLKIWSFVRNFLGMLIALLQLNVLWKLICSFIRSFQTIWCNQNAGIAVLIILVCVNLLLPQLCRVKKVYVLLGTVIVCLVLGNVIALLA